MVVTLQTAPSGFCYYLEPHVFCNLKTWDLMRANEPHWHGIHWFTCKVIILFHMHNFVCLCTTLVTEVVSSLKFCVTLIFYLTETERTVCG